MYFFVFDFIMPLPDEFPAGAHDCYYYYYYYDYVIKVWLCSRCYYSIKSYLIYIKHGAVKLMYVNARIKL